MTKKISKEFKVALDEAGVPVTDKLPPSAATYRKCAGLDKTESAMKEPIANKLDKRLIAKLFRMLCVHREKHSTEIRFEDVWQDCSDCILHEIPWSKGISCKKNLCYAIWHEGILNG